MGLNYFLKSRFELNSPNRIIPMEGMRGFAALLVFFVHFQSLFGKYIAGEWSFKIALFMGSIGHTGVDLFFVLSGFLVYGIVVRSQFNFKKYLLRRIQRLYPVFVTVLVSYIVLSYAFPEHSKLPADAISTVVFILANLAMLPGMTQIEPIITVSWSLSYEWFFYLIMPVLIGFIGMRRWNCLFRIVFFLASSGIYWLASNFGFAHHPRLILFSAGILMWEIFGNNSASFRLPRWGEPIVVSLFAIVLAMIGISKQNVGPVELILSQIPHFYVPLLFISIFLLVIYGMFHRGILCSFFSWTPLRWVGNMSYSYYLIHGLALQGLSLLVEKVFADSHLPPSAFLTLLLVSIAITLMSAAVLYLAIEKPLSIDK